MTVALILQGKGPAVVTVSPDTSMEAAIAMMAERRIGAVVVTGHDRSVAGILSERDVVRALAVRGADATADTVADHMTRKVVTTTPQETVAQVMERMTEGRFRHLPVIAEGRLGGIVSIGDVVKLRLAEIEAEASAMRAYIASG